MPNARWATRPLPDFAIRCGRASSTSSSSPARVPGTEGTFSCNYGRRCGTLKANGKVRQDGDLAQMIWNVPEVIVKLSEMVELAAGDIIMTGTPSGVAATVAGDKLECEIEGMGKLTVTIGPPAK